MVINLQRERRFQVFLTICRTRTSYGKLPVNPKLWGYQRVADLKLTFLPQLTKEGYKNQSFAVENGHKCLRKELNGRFRTIDEAILARPKSVVGLTETPTLSGDKIWPVNDKQVSAPKTPSTWPNFISAITKPSSMEAASGTTSFWKDLKTQERSNEMEHMGEAGLNFAKSEETGQFQKMKLHDTYRSLVMKGGGQSRTSCHRHRIWFEPTTQELSTANMVWKHEAGVKTMTSKVHFWAGLESYVFRSSFR